MTPSHDKLAMPVQNRLSSVDFWRGVVLVTIFIDHTPGNVFSWYTLRNFNFADAAEAFVFLSGLVLAYVCWPALGRGDFSGTVARCLRRSAQLYGAHLALTFGAIVLFGVGYILSGSLELVTDANRGLAFDEPSSALTGTLLLAYQIGFFNILPVYIVLMLLAPLLLWLVHRNVVIALLASAAGYAVARLGYWPPNWPGTYSWFLNPFAWQFLFTVGMVAGGAARGGGIRYSRPIFLAALSVVAFALVYTRGLLPTGWYEVEPYLDFSKGDLGFLRLISFLSLAYVVAQLKLGDLLLKFPGAGEVARLGRQSLSIFSAGSILSAVATIILSFPAVAGNHLAFDIIGMLSVILGTAIFVGLARYLECRQANMTGRIPSPAKALGG